VAGKNGISGTILSVASREDASLVVMRSQPMSRLSSIFMENTTTRILRRCTMRDMLIYPANSAEKSGDMHGGPFIKNIFTRVLCPTDFSSFSSETLEWAAQLDSVSEIILVHVIPARGPREPRVSLLAAEQKLAGMKSSLDRNDLKMTTIVGEGDPAREIGRIAGEQNASLILMPRCGMGQHINGGEIGNTVAAVANHLNRPLLVRRSRIRLHEETRKLPIK
jgi:nucleotide-binding universal stress UspA family protein